VICRHAQSVSRETRLARSALATGLITCTALTTTYVELANFHAISLVAFSIDRACQYTSIPAQCACVCVFIISRLISPRYFFPSSDRCQGLQTAQVNALTALVVFGSVQSCRYHAAQKLYSIFRPRSQCVYLLRGKMLLARGKTVSIEFSSAGFFLHFFSFSASSISISSVRWELLVVRGGLRIR
jgi:hypothetical protein